MPRPTFSHLPAEKRARVVAAALAEFAASPYDEASINRVVRAAGIAKGSVWQYFDDKFDLFAWLVGEAGRRRAARMAGLVVAPAPGADVFDELVAGYRLGLADWVAEPAWGRILLRAQEPSAEPRLAALRAEGEAKVHAFLVDWIQRGQAAGAVRADLAPDVGAWLAQGLLQEGLLRAFLGRLGVTLDALAAGAALDPAAVEAATGVVDEVVGVLRAGWGAPASP